MKPSKIKLEEFNNCPGTESIKDYLYKHYLEPYVKVIDLDESHSFHVNDRDTLVLAILKGPTETQVALAIGQLAVQFAADEFTWKAIEDTYIIRLWWD